MCGGVSKIGKERKLKAGDPGKRNLDLLRLQPGALQWCACRAERAPPLRTRSVPLAWFLSVLEQSANQTKDNFVCRTPVKTCNPGNREVCEKPWRHRPAGVVIGSVQVGPGPSDEHRSSARLVIYRPGTIPSTRKTASLVPRDPMPRLDEVHGCCWKPAEHAQEHRQVSARLWARGGRRCARRPVVVIRFAVTEASQSSDRHEESMEDRLFADEI